MFPLIPIAPDPILFNLGFLQIGWYGVGYVVALGVMLFVTQFEAERRGINRSHVWNALLLVGALALIGGRLYHVIDEFDLYRDDLLKIFLPPYAGLGLYGGVAGAALGIFIYTRWQKLPLRLSLDAVIPGTLFAQGIARWGNFFNQELFGPPTDVPWAIPIECANRVASPWPCPPGSAPDAILPAAEGAAGFHPMFFYESSLDILGGLVALWISRRYLHRLQPGDVTAFWGIWYGAVRTLLEPLRSGYNWTLGGPEGIATAQVIGIALMLIGAAWIAYNHRPGTRPFAYPEPVRAPEPEPDPFAEGDPFADDDLDDEDDFDEDTVEDVAAFDEAADEEGRAEAEDDETRRPRPDE